jgi:hypothetical protein
MKKLLLLPAFVLGMGYCVTAQSSPETAIRQEISDSTLLIFNQIDQLSVFELKKYRESYVYKCRMEPCDRNRAILAYIEQRMTTLK